MKKRLYCRKCEKELDEKGQRKNYCSNCKSLCSKGLAALYNIERPFEVNWLCRKHHKGKK